MLRLVSPREPLRNVSTWSFGDPILRLFDFERIRLRQLSTWNLGTPRPRLIRFLQGSLEKSMHLESRNSQAQTDPFP